MAWRRLSVAAGLLLCPALLAGQSPDQPRPRPYPPFESPAFQRAVERGTRTRDGTPGPRYWQQRADYALAATLDPAARRLTGEGTVRYANRSPDTLTVVWFHLHQNLFAPGALRNEPTPVTEGMELGRVVAQGQALAAVDDSTAAGYQVRGTRLRIRLPAPLPPGGTAPFEFAWSFTVPPDGAPRGGEDGEVFFLSYWYPQVAVYDDLGGWQVDAYLSNAEFYMGYGDYAVAITLPHGWLVGATGFLVNQAEVLSPGVRERLQVAARGTRVVPVVTDEGRGPGAATLRSPDGRLTWRFRADNVRDFAFGASDRYLWDATTAQVGDLDGDKVAERTAIFTFYRPSRRAWAWDQSARYAQHSIEFLSRYLWPYPYPQATAVDGVRSCAGMEYPMITCIGGPRDTLRLYSVIVHELAHMWFPMQVGSDEKRHSWQDEGLTRFNQAQAMREFFRGYDQQSIARDSYLALARRGGEVDLMRHGDLYPPDSPAFGIASYDKTATNLVALRGLIGEQRFLEGYRAYGRAWSGRHPAPWDFFHALNRAAGEDLGWFWRTWWFETWTLDQAVARVVPGRDSTTIVIEDRGLAPMPTRIAVRRVGGTTERYEIPVEVWLDGARRHEFRVPASPAVASVEIDPERHFPDIDRSNNVWRGL